VSNKLYVMVANVAEVAIFAAGAVAMILAAGAVL